MNILITDDEKSARERLASLVERLPGCRTVGFAENGVEAVYKTYDLGIDVVLMDIRLPKMDGLEAARHISEARNPPAIVFTTAYAEHTLEAFGLHSMGYLLKPIQLDALRDTLQHIQRARLRQVAEPIGDAIYEQHYVRCNRRGEINLVALNQVYYIRSFQKYSRIFYATGVAYTHQTLQHLEDKFCKQVLRIHRSYLVNKNYLRTLESDDGEKTHYVRLYGVHRVLPVSRRNLPGVREFINTFAEPAALIRERELMLARKRFREQKRRWRR